MALTGGVLFGVSGTVAAGLFSSITPAELNQYRLVAGAAIVSGMAARKGLVRHEGNLGWLALLGLITATVTYLYYVAVERLGVGPGTTIQFVAPVLMLLWRRFVQHLAVPSTAWTGAAGAVIGVGLVTGAFSAEYADSVGMLAGLGAAFSFAALTIVAEKLGKTLHPITYTAYGLTIAALIWAAALPVSTPHLSVVGWVGIAWVTIMGMGIPFLLLMSSLRHISPGPAGVAATSEPIVGALVAWVALGQTLSLPQVMGVALTVLGVAVVQFSTRRTPGF